MPRKKPSSLGKDPLFEGGAISDLDPTTNEQLRLDVFSKLKDKIAKEISRIKSGEIKKAAPIHFGLFDDRLSDDLSKERRFGQDIRRLVKLVSAAFLNPYKIPWDVEKYHSQHVKSKKDPHRLLFPNPDWGKLSEPLTVVDLKGRIVLWYLPGLLSENQNSDVRKATMKINRSLKRSVKEENPEASTPNWRINERNFFRKRTAQVLEPGAVTFSAGWFGQGHASDEYDLKPSWNLRNEVHLGTRLWVQTSNNVERFLNLTLSLINPDLFKCGLAMLRKLRQMEDTKDIALEWQSVYTGIAIICNRLTPAHRDSKGRLEWYDTLVNYSGATGRPRLLIKDLGLNLEYSSGTVVSFCGTIFEHEVEAWGDCDRVCYAHFMRESVRQRLDVAPAGWLEQRTYLP